MKVQNREIQEKLIKVANNFKFIRILPNKREFDINNANSLF